MFAITGFVWFAALPIAIKFAIMAGILGTVAVVETGCPDPTGPGNANKPDDGHAVKLKNIADLKVKQPTGDSFIAYGGSPVSELTCVIDGSGKLECPGRRELGITMSPVGYFQSLLGVTIATAAGEGGSPIEMVRIKDGEIAGHASVDKIESPIPFRPHFPGSVAYYHVQKPEDMNRFCFPVRTVCDGPIGNEICSAQGAIMCFADKPSNWAFNRYPVIHAGFNPASAFMAKLGTDDVLGLFTRGSANGPAEIRLYDTEYPEDPSVPNHGLQKTISLGNVTAAPDIVFGDSGMAFTVIETPAPALVSVTPASNVPTFTSLSEIVRAPIASLAISGATLYFAEQDKRIVAVDVATGRQKGSVYNLPAAPKKVLVFGGFLVVSDSEGILEPINLSKLENGDMDFSKI